jgi:surface antigen
MIVSSPSALRHLRRGLARAVAWSTLALPVATLATPPPWAPAHGWRAKNDPYYTGYSGHEWPRDYGIQSGRCDREEIGALLGGITGGAVGATTAKPTDRAVAMVVGTVIGAAIGAEIGRRMDKADRACTGHALELATVGQSVRWKNNTTGVSYKLTPVDRNAADDGCRRFRLVATGAFGLSEGRATACPRADGVWELAPAARVTRR